ncbi:TPA: HAD-IIB family hydrolase [Staphylococcus aureus]
MSKRLLLFDFDETYFKHNTNEEDLSHLREMEKLLEKLTNNNEVITAVLTGSTFQSVMDKMDQVNMTFKPLHIFSDLSSKMFTWNNDEYVESETYKKKVLSEPFLFEDIEDILRHISAQYNVEFIPQRAFEGNETHYNFYFHSTGNHNNDSRILEALVRYANDQNYTARFSRSNPLAGDPENAYDIDFTPSNAGKLYATQFLMKKYNIPVKSILGFGDSGNDEAYLSYLEHAYLMSNSRDEALKQKFRLTKYPYYQGITLHVKEFVEGKYDY